MNTISVKLVFLFTTLLLASLLPEASTATPIYACVHKTTGQLRRVEAPGQCHRAERELTWDDGSGLQGQINALLGRVTLLEQAIGVLNDAPTVNAGPDQSILLASYALFDGLVSDDGILLPVTMAWTQVSGPGVAVFDNALGAETGVTFDAVGEYVLQLTVSDGLVSVTDETIVRVFPDNDPPVVDAGPDQTLTGTTSGGILTCTTVVSGTATDDGLPEPLAVLWSGGTGVASAGKGGAASGSFVDERAFSRIFPLKLLNIYLKINTLSHF